MSSSIGDTSFGEKSQTNGVHGSELLTGWSNLPVSDNPRKQVLRSKTQIMVNPCKIIISLIRLNSQKLSVE